MKTSRPHFEELDWLDYTEGVLPQAEADHLATHLQTCAGCRSRVEALRRVSAALPMLGTHLEGVVASDADRASLYEAIVAAELTAEAISAAQQSLAPFRSLSSAAALPNLRQEHVLAALRNAKDLFLTEPSQAEELVAWATSTFAQLEEDHVSWPGLAGVVSSYAAYVRFRHGETLEALQDLDAARPLLARTVPLRDLEVAFSSYVRAACLHNLSRFGEALVAVREAETVYAAFGDDRRVVRARILHALILCDAGFPEQALPMHDALLHHSAAIGEPSIYAYLYLNYASNLVFLGKIGQAKAAYAKTTKLLRDTHQEHLLFKVRTGLADIAHREGRIADALAINVALRPEYQRQQLAWDEVRRELWIIRELLALKRLVEARESCEELAARARALSLPVEAKRALAYLGDVQNALDALAVDAIRDDLQRIVRGEPTRWSVA
jgi:tetratricopeptide (TPR) repeat protein